MIRLVIDGKEVFGRSGQTILEVCNEAGIYIPTLCHHPLLESHGTCQICVVELAGHGLVTSCSTRVADGMVIQTDTARIASARKQRLEAMLVDHYGDCVAPCQDACPADVDIQGYIALIARGAYREAVELIKEALPLPAVIGRVCPHPCEEACRRNLVDQSISICGLKRFAADYTLSRKERVAPVIKPRSGFRVAVVGSGPCGLSAAYYLIKEGHEVVMFEALPELGGMLRYGIPDYRLPKDLLEQEIGTITELGVIVKTNHALGRDFTVKSLLEDGFHAVFLAIGAHQSQRINVEGEHLQGVLPGTGFLRAVALGHAVDLGKRVAVIGGGDTAIDAARTALRLGAEQVTVVYRRSRSEMPAIKEEVEEAEEEGIRLHFLAAPVRVIGENGRVKGIECIKMKLGEPDASGRPRPQPVAGSEFVLQVESVIAAIGQYPELFFLTTGNGLKVERGNIVVAPDTFMTSMTGVFAGGDCVTGAGTAVEAIAAGRKAAVAINRYLKGEGSEGVANRFSFSKGQPHELAGAEEFVRVERKPRRKAPKLRPAERRNNFQEIDLGYSEDMARKEAERCLECGCKAAYDCTVRQLATEYKVSPAPVKKGRYYYPLDKSHPFIERDPNKCIGCGLCARLCLGVQGIGALSVSQRVGTVEGYSASLLNTTCVSCGLCADSCPVGALVAKNQMRPAFEVKTVCAYCGVGCGIHLGVRGGVVVSLRGDVDNPVNKGSLCVKGRFGYDFINHPDRLTAPLIKRNGEFVAATWEEALELIASKLANYKGEQFATISSAKCTNEASYIVQKFTRAVMGTNNIDHCARLCHAPSVAGLAQTLGSGAMTNSVNEIKDAACILAIGTNTTVAHPVIGLEVIRAVRNGASLIVANPKRIDLCRFADLWLQQRPGTDVALLMGMMRVIVDEGLLDSSFIEQRCQDFDVFKKSLQNLDLVSAEQITGVPERKIAEAARIFATSKPATILYAMGITQHTHGTDNVLAISNLALLTGNLGKPGSGVNPLRGQNNVQGACDMGTLPNVLPGYQRVDDPQLRGKFETAWGCTLPEKPGLTLTEMFDAILQGKIKAVYLMGFNPLLSEADAHHAERALRQLEFLVVQDIFLTETARLAHVVLPAAAFAEKHGTFTNTERRVQLVRKAVDPPGQARPDWWIICQLAQRMGAPGFSFAHPAEIMAEIASLAPIYGGISYQRLEQQGLQWPCPSADHPGTPILHTERFATPNGKARFVPLQFKPPAEPPDAQYPLVLTTDRSLYQYHTGTKTRRVAGIEALDGQEWLCIHPDDAARLQVADGQRVRVCSRRGQVIVRAKVTAACLPGVVSMSFHFAETPTNVLTHAALDALAKTPATKVCAVRVEPLAATEQSAPAQTTT